MMNPDVNEVSPLVVSSETSMTTTTTSGTSKVPFVRRRSSGGSLPFKKRKLYHARCSSMSSDPLDTRSSDEHHCPFKSSSLCGSASASNVGCVGGGGRGGNDDEKIAALALVAAATSSLPLPTPMMNNNISATLFPGLFLSSPTATVQHVQRMHYIQDEATTTSTTSTTRGSSPESHQSSYTTTSDSSAAALLQDVSSSSPSSSPTGSLLLDSNSKHRQHQPPNKSSSSKPIRVHHPPLMSPLPGGCHGRTSRNNSYCRRQPCYNGSNYCKLHYQMHVVKGVRPPTTTTDHRDSTSSNGDGDSNSTSLDSNRTSSSSMNVQQKVKRRNSPTSASTTTTHASSSAAAVIVQTDKRFQGLPGEVKCSATTTRGRPCSYVCVNDTAFCYLHADYATNPPPRRGGGNGGSSSGAAASSAIKKKLSSSTAASSSSSSIRGVDAHATTAAAAAKSPRPDNVDLSDGSIVLKTPNTQRGGSMTGAPMDGSTNLMMPSSSSSSSAWITPQASTVSESSTSSATTTSTTTTPRRHKKKKRILSPCGKPVLSSLAYDQWLNQKVMISTGPLANHMGHVVKWGNGWVTVRVSSDEQGNSRDEDGLLHNRRAIELFLVPNDTDAVEIGMGPRVAKTVQQDVQLQAFGETSNLLRRCVSMDATSSEAQQLRQGTISPSDHNVFQVDTKEDGDTAETLVEEGSDNVSSGERSDKIKEEKMSFGARNDESKEEPTDVLTVSSPSNPTETGDSPPLANSLLTRDGCRKQGLGLLFGTAALERGRRKVHKPSRYEDTAMLEKPRSGRQHDSEYDLSASCRRTPVSSPRSPANHVSSPRSPRKLPTKT